jgi:hypothetical protein
VTNSFTSNAYYAKGLKGGNKGIVEKAQETIFGMSQKCSRYIGIAF